MPVFYVDGDPIEFEQGESVLHAALRHHHHIPYYCYHPGLSVVAQCRMCLVEVPDMGNGRPMPKLQAACATKAMENMQVVTQSEQVRETQNEVNEYLLVNHPLDCPICDQAGECDLQDYAFAYGSGRSEMDYEKRVYGWRNVGSYIMLERNRCIHCSRCERFSSEVEGGDDFAAFFRTHELTFDTFDDEQITHKFQGNLVDLCPVGAITEREFRFKKRAWKLKKTPSVCPTCSTGCNITVDHHDNHVERLKPRENQEVNRWWMCDEGRIAYRRLNDREHRHTEPLARVKGRLHSAEWEAVYRAVARKLADLGAGGGQVLGIADTHASNEELYLFRRLLGEALGSEAVYFPYRPGTWPRSGNFLRTLITTDKSPNTEGALALGLAGDTDDRRLMQALQGQPKAVFLLGSPYAGEPAVREQVARADLIVQIATDGSPWQEAADVILPGLTYAEKAGTFTNKHRRVQRFQPAVRGPETCRDQSRILLELLETFGKPLTFPNARAVLDAMGSEDGAFHGVSWQAVGDLGLPLETPERRATA